jgi:serine carboxypeptidase-like clade I
MYHIASPKTLVQNPFSWNNITNGLFMESPAGVGYSYCSDPAGCSHTDTSTADDNLAALLDFFGKYPELKNNNFWIAGESYAGIYVPSLAYAVYNYNVKNPSTAINLKGILVGNGCIGDQAGHCGNDPTGLSDYHDIMQWRGHGLISETTFDTVMKVCDWPNESQQCQNALNQAASEVGDIDVYYLYNTCADPAATVGEEGRAAVATSGSSTLRAPYGSKGMLARLNNVRKAAGKPELGNDPNCYGTGPELESWFNQAEVKQAFHVATGIDWSLCSNNGTFQYNPNIADERTTIYPTLTQKAGYKVLVYNGEADLCVPYTDNEWWTRSMNYSVVKPWTSWNVNSVYGTGPYVGGYVIQYGHNFTFATVRGAGHMVPETRGEASFTMMRNHISSAGWA